MPSTVIARVPSRGGTDTRARSLLSIKSSTGMLAISKSFVMPSLKPTGSLWPPGTNGMPVVRERTHSPIELLVMAIAAAIRSREGGREISRAPSPI